MNKIITAVFAFLISAHAFAAPQTINGSNITAGSMLPSSLQNGSGNCIYASPSAGTSGPITCRQMTSNDAPASIEKTINKSTSSSSVPNGYIGADANGNAAIATGGTGSSTVVGAARKMGTWKGIRLGCFGDSRCANGYYYATSGAYGTYPLMYSEGRGIGQWAQFFSRGLLTLDYSTGYGPVAYSGGAAQVTVTAGGSNYSNSPSVSATGCTATFTPTVAGGVITSVAIASSTGSCASSPTTLTITDGTGSGAAGFVTVSNGGSLGGPGETTTQILARLNDACNDTNDAELVFAGTNDVTNSITVATTESNLQQIYEGLMKCGKFVIAVTDAPRNQSSVTSTQQLQIYAVDRWKRDYVKERTSVNSSIYSNIQILDVAPLWGNANDSNGAQNTNCFIDGTHPASGCAMVGGFETWGKLKQRFGLTPQQTGSSQRNDLYDATNNPYGPLATSPYMAASGGTVNSPLTGTLATGYTCSRSGSATIATAALAIEGPAGTGTRTDLYSGNRQTLVVSAGSGTSSEHYTCFTSTYTLATLGISTGDKLQAKVDLEISGTTKMNELYMDLKCVDNSSVVQARAVAGHDVVGDYFPDTGTLDAFSTANEFTMMTPDIGMTVPVACTKVFMDLVFGIDASGGAASAGFTAKWTNWKLVKVQ